jgi:hypothetical protein
MASFFMPHTEITEISFADIQRKPKKHKKTKKTPFCRLCLLPFSGKYAVTSLGSFM